MANSSTPKVEVRLTTNNNTDNTQSTTTVKDILKKFTSRKFIMSLVGVIVGILGMFGCSDNTTAIVAFAALEILSILAYIIAEGRVDAAAVKNITDVVNMLVDMITQANNGQNVVVPENKPSDDILDTLPQAVAYSMQHPESKVVITVENQDKSITLEATPSNTPATDTTNNVY